jgi:HEAT repeat protein
LGQLGAAVVAAHPAVVDQLLQLTRDRSSNVRLAAASALGQLGAAVVAAHPAVVDQLLQLTRDDSSYLESWEVRLAAASALGQLGAAVVAAHPAVVDRLLQLTRDGFWDLKQAAAESLGRLMAGGARLFKRPAWNWFLLLFGRRWIIRRVEQLGS